MDDRIHLLEINIADATIKQRKITALITTYSFIIYLIWLLSFFFIIWPQLTSESGLWEVVLQTAPIIVGPLMFVL